MEFSASSNNKILYSLNYLEYPLVIQVEITDKCNLKCEFCYNNSKSSNCTNILDNIDFKSFLNDVFKFGGVFCWIISGGEPLLYKKSLLSFLSDLNNDHSGLVMITNGYYLDENFAKKISSYNWYWVQVSIDSSIPETHNKIRGVNDSFEHAVMAVKHLKKHNINTVISSVISDKNIDDIENLVKMAIRLNANGIIFSDVKESGRAKGKNKVYLSNNNKNKYSNEIKKCQKKYGKDIMIKSAQLDNVINNSGDLRMGFLIRPNGDVKLNCLSEKIEGNIFKQNFFELWEKIKKGD